MKKVIKNLLIIIVSFGIITSLVIMASNNFDKKAKQCDEAYGYQCSYYQVRNFKK